MVQANKSMSITMSHTPVHLLMSWCHLLLMSESSLREEKEKQVFQLQQKQVLSEALPTHLHKHQGKCLPNNPAAAAFCSTPTHQDRQVGSQTEAHVHFTAHQGSSSLTKALQSPDTAEQHFHSLQACSHKEHKVQGSLSHALVTQTASYLGWTTSHWWQHTALCFTPAPAKTRPQPCEPDSWSSLQLPVNPGLKDFTLSSKDPFDTHFSPSTAAATPEKTKIR